MLAAILLLVGTAIGRSSAYAQMCGDADRSGTVTVTDGVQILRAAAALSSACTPEVCDLSLDGTTTVSDGVRALRVAAELEASPGCLVDQARSAIGRTQSIMEVGIAVIPSAGALTAAATVPCPDGGSSEETANGLTDVDCRRGDLVSNGSVVFTDVPGTPNRQASFQSFRVERLSTSETLVSSGTLVFSPHAGAFTVDGTISRSSTLLGEFTDTFTSVTAQATGGAVSLSSGTVTSTVTNGIGGFAHISTLQTNIVGPRLTIVLVTFVDATPQVAIVADDIGLCDVCTSSSQCNSQLACLPCNSECTGTVSRCSVTFQNFAARCQDGLF